MAKYLCSILTVVIASNTTKPLPSIQLGANRKSLNIAIGCIKQVKKFKPGAWCLGFTK